MNHVFPVQSVIYMSIKSVIGAALAAVHSASESCPIAWLISGLNQHLRLGGCERRNILGPKGMDGHEDVQEWDEEADGYMRLVPRTTGNQEAQVLLPMEATSFSGIILPMSAATLWGRYADGTSEIIIPMSRGSRLSAEWVRLTVVVRHDPNHPIQDAIEPSLNTLHGGSETSPLLDQCPHGDALIALSCVFSWPWHPRIHSRAGFDHKPCSSARR